MILLNDEKVQFEVFPNGETRIPEKQIRENLLAKNHIAFKYEDDSDLIKLLLLKKYLDDLDTQAQLQIQYMPYSRMDRREDNSAFTLKYVADFINGLNFASIEIVEPHSDVSTALVNKSHASYPSIDLLDDVVKHVGFKKDTDYLFFPDAGAQKRYSKVKGYKQLVGFKERDFATGRINSLQVVGGVDSTPFKVIILDDLCSYGGTFIKSAEQLRPLGASEIYLLVGHCEKSIYSGDIFKTDLIDKVFTTNSMMEQSEHAKLHIFNI
ncbi:MAG: ribose-phosphate pyrophosphokinase [Candidatus Pristimantibacillus sp.]